MADTWHLQVRTPEQLLLDLSAVSHVQAHLIDGPITLLRGHIPLVGETAAGALRYYTADGGRGQVRLQPGILLVERHKITVLTSGLSDAQARVSDRPNMSDD